MQWSVLDNETDVTFLVQLLLHWLTTLRLPLITEELLEKINSAETAEDQMTCFTKEKLETVNFIIKFFREVDF